MPAPIPLGEYKTDFDTTTLPTKVQEAISNIYEALGLEPTHLRDPAHVWNGEILAVYYGGLMYLHYDKAKDNLTLSINGYMRVIPDRYPAFTADFYRAFRTVLAGVVRLPKLIQHDGENDYVYGDLKTALGYTLVRRWDVARRFLEKWRENPHSTKAVSADVREELYHDGMVYLNEHEAACLALGQTEPLCVDVSWQDTDNYTIGDGGYVFEWSYTITTDPITGQGHLHVQFNGGDFSDMADLANAPKTTAEGVAELEGRVEELEKELARARLALQLARRPNTTFSYDYPDEEEEDDEDDDDADDSDGSED